MNRARERRNAKPSQIITPAIPPPPLPPMPCQSAANDFDLPAQYTEESPLIVDNTILSSFATCSTKATIAYHHNLVAPEDSNHLILGSATHKALELFFKGTSSKDALATFQQLYYPYGSLLDPEEPLSWDNTLVTLESWFTAHSLPSLSFTPLPGMIEGALTAPLWEEKWGKRVLYLGLVDLLVQEKATGLLSIMDHKTTSKRLDDSWVGQFKTSAQLSGYIWLTQQTGVSERLDKASPIQSAYINTIQYSHLPMSDRKCVKHAVPYSICRGLHAVARLDGPFMRSPLQLNQWLDNTRQLTRDWAWTRENFPSLDNLRAVPKQGLFHYEACKFCSYVPFCEGTINDGKRLPQFYKRSAWEPWKNGEKERSKNL